MLGSSPRVDSVSGGRGALASAPATCKLAGRVEFAHFAAVSPCAGVTVLGLTPRVALVDVGRGALASSPATYTRVE